MSKQSVYLSVCEHQPIGITRSRAARHPYTQTVTTSAGRTEAEQNCPPIALSNFHTDGEVE